MRNLLNLIIVNHRLVLFVVLEICALKWMDSTHAMHNNRMSNMGIKCSNSWLDMVGHFETYSEVMSENKSLNEENARLRAQNMKLSSLTPLVLDSSVIEVIDTSHWASFPGEIVRMTINFNDNLLVGNKGLNDGIVVGSGVLDDGCLTGKVVQVTDGECLIFPVIHRGVEWSVRIGKMGAHGRLIWDGEDVNNAIVVDIVKSSMILPGEKVYTTGYQGLFPADILVGEVVKVDESVANDFKTVFIKLGTDYRSIRYVEFLTDLTVSSADSLIKTSVNE